MWYSWFWRKSYIWEARRSWPFPREWDHKFVKCILHPDCVSEWSNVGLIKHLKNHAFLWTGRVGHVGWGRGKRGSWWMDTVLQSPWGWEEEVRSWMPCLMANVSPSQKEHSRFFLLASRKAGDLSSFSLCPSPWSSNPCFQIREADLDGPDYS